MTTLEQIIRNKIVSLELKLKDKKTIDKTAVWSQINVLKEVLSEAPNSDDGRGFQGNDSFGNTGAGFQGDGFGGDGMSGFRN